MKRIIALLVMFQLVALGFLIVISPGYVLAQSGGRFEYIFPLPNSHFVSPATTIAIRPGARINAGTLNSASFNVVGSISGAHAGSVILADDQTTVIFRPTRQFTAGEAVKVVLTGGLRTDSGQPVGVLSFVFTIAARQVPPPPNTLIAPGESPVVPRAPQTNVSPRTPKFATLPSTIPPITITVPANGTDAGYVFIAPGPLGVSGTPYMMIMGNSGQPVYYSEPATMVFDFKEQPNGMLTYFMGSKFYVMDNSYTVVDTFQGGNGYIADLHDFQLLPNGDALFLNYDSQQIDMSQIVAGGSPTATVTGCIIQEQDASKNVVFQWSSWDHFLITDTYASLTTSNVDYVHCNAIALDQDGNLLLSSRHMSEVTKINHQTGDIIWRLGGKNNQFTFVGDTPPYFTYQHDIRRLPNGDITLFDNGDLRPVPLYSRAVEYQLDEVNKTATEVWQFRNTPDTYGLAMGDTQRLSNGNTFIGWGWAGLATEVKPDNSKAFEFSVLPLLTYRAFRFSWHGYPTTQPTLVAQNPLGSTVLIYSWNGATDITSYRIYKGNAPQPTTLITTQAKTGFETTTTLPCDPFGTRYYRVMPVDVNGQSTMYSNDVMVGACIQYFFPEIGR